MIVVHGTVETLERQFKDKKVQAILSLWMGDMLFTNSNAIEGVLRAKQTLLVGIVVRFFL